MNILLLGPQGSGKGTQAKLISAQYGIPHVATGDMLREAIAEASELGRQVEPILERGDLVPDDLMISLIRERLSRADTADGFVLDGFPRTMAQAEAGLEEWAELIEGDAFETLPRVEEGFDVCFLDAEKDDYEPLFQLARLKLEPGALVVADNVLSHADALAVYSQTRQADETLESFTLPLDRGLELSVVLRETV